MLMLMLMLMYLVPWTLGRGPMPNPHAPPLSGGADFNDTPRRWLAGRIVVLTRDPMGGLNGRTPSPPKCKSMPPAP